MAIRVFASYGAISTPEKTENNRTTIVLCKPVMETDQTSCRKHERHVSTLENAVKCQQIGLTYILCIIFVVIDF
jgi:hypothetical protein